MISSACCGSVRRGSARAAVAALSTVERVRCPPRRRSRPAGSRALRGCGRSPRGEPAAMPRPAPAGSRRSPRAGSARRQRRRCGPGYSVGEGTPSASGTYATHGLTKRRVGGGCGDRFNGARFGDVGGRLPHCRERERRAGTGFRARTFSMSSEDSRNCGHKSSSHPPWTLSSASALRSQWPESSKHLVPRGRSTRRGLA